MAPTGCGGLIVSRNVWSIASPMPSTLLQLSVKQFAQNSVARSIGRKTPVAIKIGSISKKRCAIDNSHDCVKDWELSSAESCEKVQPSDSAGQRHEGA